MNSSEFVPTTFTITGKSIEEIKQQLWNEYGSNYKIMDTKTILQGGFLGLFQKNIVKVWYIVKDRQKEASESLAQARENILKSAGVDYSKVASKQYSELTDMLSKMNTQIEELKNSSSGQRHPSIAKIEKLLEQNEFSGSFIDSITSRLVDEFPLKDLDDFDLVQMTVVDWIGQSIKIAPVIYRKSPQVIVLVGPTGLGKTTTISKMAAKTILDAKKNGSPCPVVRLITIDYTRVGAEVQLRKFGEMMNVRVDKAENSDDLSQIIQDCRESTDYIFIDTAGFSQKDYDNIAKMRKILNVAGVSMETYLVVAASTKARDLTKIIENFAMFNINSVIITKCDETTTYGNVLSVLNEHNKAVAFITDGQKVPRDFKRASVREFLFNLVDFKLDKLHIEDMFPEDE